MEERKKKDGSGVAFIFFPLSIFMTKHILKNGLWVSRSANPEGGGDNFVNCKSEILLVADAKHM